MEEKYLRIDCLLWEELVFIICHNGLNMYYRYPQAPHDFNKSRQGEE